MKLHLISTTMIYSHTSTCDNNHNERGGEGRKLEIGMVTLDLVLVYKIVHMPTKYRQP